jgi:cell division GTPase FtsZ
MDNAELGIGYLSNYVDALVVVPNDKLLLVTDKSTTIEQSFKLANEVLRQGVQAITDIITQKGLINVDFADVNTVMANRGLAHMGVGHGKGGERVADAVKEAIENPLLETSIDGAQAILLNVTGGHDLSRIEVNDAAERIKQAADKDVLLIFGTAVYEDIVDEINITVIATGFEPREALDVKSEPPAAAGISSTGAGAAGDDDEDADILESLAYGGGTASNGEDENDDDPLAFGFNDRDIEAGQGAGGGLYGSGAGGRNDFTVPEFLRKD